MGCHQSDTAEQAARRTTGKRPLRLKRHLLGVAIWGTLRSKRNGPDLVGTGLFSRAEAQTGNSRRRPLYTEVIISKLRRPWATLNYQRWRAQCSASPPDCGRRSRCY